MGPTEGTKADTDPRGKETARTGNSWMDGQTDGAWSGRRRDGDSQHGDSWDGDSQQGLAHLRPLGHSGASQNHRGATAEEIESHTRISGCKQHLKGASVAGGDRSAVTRALSHLWQQVARPRTWHQPWGGKFGKETEPRVTGQREERGPPPLGTQGRGGGDRATPGTRLEPTGPRPRGDEPRRGSGPGTGGVTSHYPTRAP